MDDQAAGGRPGEGGLDRESAHVRLRPRLPLQKLLLEVVGGDGLSFEVCRQVVDARYDPEILEPYLIGLVPRCNGQVLYGLATLCLELVGQTGSYRAAAEAAIAAESSPIT